MRSALYPFRAHPFLRFALRDGCRPLVLILRNEFGFIPKDEAAQIGSVSPQFQLILRR
jgi:hypothetical protein